MSKQRPTLVARFGREPTLLTPSYRPVRLHSIARFSSQIGFTRVGLALVMLLWFLVLGWAAIDRQNIFDWWQLRYYNPPASVSQLATQDTFTPYARKVFYVNKPAIEDKQSFSKACPNNGQEQTIVLGCYHGYQAGIYVLSVSDPRLSGVEQVTAAHEMLHAAYDRLSSADRSRVNGMLLDYYNHDLHDPRIRTTIAAYKKSEPHDVVNEMHSVFGTEVKQLPPALEQYYKRYFTNRSQIAAYAAQYQAEFTSRQTAVIQDDIQLQELKTQVSSLEADLQVKQSTITANQATLTGEKNRGDISAYNAGVPNYNSLVDAYNNEVQAVRVLIKHYNQLVVARNAIALEEGQLVNELSSNVTPINH